MRYRQANRTIFSGCALRCAIKAILVIISAIYITILLQPLDYLACLPLNSVTQVIFLAGDRGRRRKRRNEEEDGGEREGEKAEIYIILMLLR